MWHVTSTICFNEDNFNRHLFFLLLKETNSPHHKANYNGKQDKRMRNLKARYNLLHRLQQNQGPTHGGSLAPRGINSSAPPRSDTFRCDHNHSERELQQHKGRKKKKKNRTYYITSPTQFLYCSPPPPSTHTHTHKKKGGGDSFVHR